MVRAIVVALLLATAIGAADPAAARDRSDRHWDGDRHDRGDWNHNRRWDNDNWGGDQWGSDWNNGRRWGNNWGDDRRYDNYGGSYNRWQQRRYNESFQGRRYAPRTYQPPQTINPYPWDYR